MILANFGAKVFHMAWDQKDMFEFVNQRKQSLALNLKTPEGKGKRFIFEKEDILQKNLRFNYAAISTGMNLSSRYSQCKHNVNCFALSGVLSKFGQKNEKPYRVLGAMGVVMALFERAQSGQGQASDANVIESVARVISVLWYLHNKDSFNKAEGENLQGGGVLLCETYQTSKGSSWPSSDWLRLKTLFAHISKKRQAEWCKIFVKLDAFVTPVLMFEDISQLLKNKEQSSFIMDQ
ncbi:hypothetical protein E2I00_014777 [Balaenoptera physalus]|uniref:Uncharacterized protein n=1 Tax=Balaenoptera physalus TaxID=9770 RepID=A0A643C513_BALPH|nr:hypothetical protein E2I00_014777 [Balaenoptera physalus]